jgi:hypothetical protein
MVMRATLLAAISLLIGVGWAHSAPQSRVLWQGPALAGNAVVWGEELNGTGSIHRWIPHRRNQVLYRGDSLALTRPLVASAKLIAFGRSYPGCAPEPNQVCPQVEDAVIGPARGPFKRLVAPRKCSMPTLGNTIALDGGVAAYLELDCSRQRLRVLVRDVVHSKSARLLVDAPLSGGCCRNLAIAGRFVAWSERNSIVVYDRRANRVAYRARIGPAAGIDVDFGFDLQNDGKLAVSYRLVEFARAGPTKIGWVSPSAPNVHLLPIRGSDTPIRIARDHIAFDRFVDQTKSTLVVADFAGRTTAIARFAPPVRLRSGFDFDGQNIVWASDRVTGNRVDCPPPGQGRPCVRRETGVTTIWLRGARGGTPRLLARLPFFDTIAQA